MFTSNEWIHSKWAKEANVKRVVETILMPSFWNTIVYILKVIGPLVQVLRHVDNERKPARGYIYEAMDRAKEAIIKAFNGMKKGIQIFLKSLMRDGNVNYISLCMQRVISWIQSISISILR